MDGAFGFIFKDKSFGESFFSRIRMPYGKFSTLIVFLKFLNSIRAGNCDINEDDVCSPPEFIACLKKIIGNDNIVAAKSFQPIGATGMHCPLVAPKGVDCRRTPRIGETDGLTLKSTDGGTRPFMNIHGALSVKHDSVKNTEMMKGYVTIVLMALSSVTLRGIHPC